MDSPPVYSSFSMLQSRAANDVMHVITAQRPWLSSISVLERCHNCLWSNMSQVVSVARAVFMTSQLTITRVCLRYTFQVSVLCSVWTENYKSISLCTGLFSIYKSALWKLINIAIFVKSDSSQMHKRILYALIHFICEESPTIFIQQCKQCVFKWNSIGLTNVNQSYLCSNKQSIYKPTFNYITRTSES